MSRTAQVLLVSLAMLATPLAGCEGRVQDDTACENNHSPKGPGMDVQSAIATAQQPARVVPKDGPHLVSKSPALQLTLRPMAVDLDMPFLVQVFAEDVCGGSITEPGQLLGEVSFFSLKVGQNQEFVLPAPELGFPSTLRENIRITVKLIPANSARKLQRVSLEVVKASFAE